MSEEQVRRREGRRVRAPATERAMPRIRRPPWGEEDERARPEVRARKIRSGRSAFSSSTALEWGKDEGLRVGVGLGLRGGWGWGWG